MLLKDDDAIGCDYSATESCESAGASAPERRPTKAGCARTAVDEIFLHQIDDCVQIVATIVGDFAVQPRIAVVKPQVAKFALPPGEGQRPGKVRTIVNLMQFFPSRRRNKDGAPGFAPLSVGGGLASGAFRLRSAASKAATDGPYCPMPSSPQKAHEIGVFKGL